MTRAHDNPAWTRPGRELQIRADRSHLERPVPERDQPVVGEDEPDEDQYDDPNDDPPAHQLAILLVVAP